ncbi:MAG TPA: chromate efflux transporter [Rhodanobacteraceae bacterium]|nr:chromate efflux transporter [Rhodanobacteraceae bacterium]
MEKQAAASKSADDTVSLAEAARVWAKIGWLGFGGPAGQIALMHRELVEKRRWISDERFLHALSYCMLLPGPEAQQLAIYIGWLMHRTAGGVIAGTLFVLPGVIVIGALSWLYATYQQLPAVAAIFFGLKAAVLAVVVEAVLRVGRRALKNRLMVAIAAAAFIVLYCFKLPFPLVILGAAAIGIVGRHWQPESFPAPASSAALAQGDYLVDRRIARGELTQMSRPLRKSIAVLVVCSVLWVGPIVAVIALFGRDSIFAQQGVFFGEAAVVTFGGAYAVLAYIAQKAVEIYGWLSPGETVDGLALAETTPGPLIMVVQYVAFLSAFRHPGGMPPYAAAVLGSLLTTWVTFAPCFLWIFLGAPYVEALRGNRTIHAALSAITAAVVGVILNLSVWFAVHTIFHTVRATQSGLVRADIPDWNSIDPAALALGAASLLAMLRFKLGMGWTLLGSAVLGASWVYASN